MLTMDYGLPTTDCRLGFGLTYGRRELWLKIPGNPNYRVAR
jgi:hypothetical protein